MDKKDHTGPGAVCLIQVIHNWRIYGNTERLTHGVYKWKHCGVWIDFIQNAVTVWIWFEQHVRFIHLRTLRLPSVPFTYLLFAHNPLWSNDWISFCRETLFDKSEQCPVVHLNLPLRRRSHFGIYIMQFLHRGILFMEFQFPCALHIRTASVTQVFVSRCQADNQNVTWAICSAPPNQKTFGGYIPPAPFPVHMWWHCLVEKKTHIY